MLRSTPVRLPPAQRPAPGGRRRNPWEPAERSRMRLLLLRSAVSRPVNEVAPLGVDTRFRGSFSSKIEHASGARHGRPPPRRVRDLPFPFLMLGE